MTFHYSQPWLLCSSDKGTVHLFAVTSAGTGGAPQLGNSGTALMPSSRGNKRSNFSFLGLSYFTSEWSLAQFRVPDYRSIVCFGQDPNTIVIVWANGSYFKCRFDPRNGGEMIKEDYKVFTSSEPVFDQ